MIKSDLFPRLFFRNEKARFWANNTVNDSRTATEYVGDTSNVEEENYLIIHPDDDPEDVPFDYEGKVIRFGQEEKINFAN